MEGEDGDDYDSEGSGGDDGSDDESSSDDDEDDEDDDDDDDFVVASAKVIPPFLYQCCRDYFLNSNPLRDFFFLTRPPLNTTI